MKDTFIGDSYDVVKRFLLESLEPDAEWVALPMFTEAITPDRIKSFERFIDVHVIQSGIITSANRSKYLVALPHHRYIFIDPDTGIRLKPTFNASSTKYVFGTELVNLCRGNPERLLLVFDQSVQRGRELTSIKKKLEYFRKHKVSAFAYVSHACFVVLSASVSTCQKAHRRLLASHLPSSKLFPEDLNPRLSQSFKS